MDGTSARQSRAVPARSGHAALGSLAGVLERIGAVVDAETEALQANKPIDMAAVNQRKRQGLLELSRIIPHVSVEELHGEPRRRLDQLSQKLERNRFALDVRLRAVREVAGIITGMIREAESDGTYSGYPTRS